MNDNQQYIAILFLCFAIVCGLYQFTRHIDSLATRWNGYEKKASISHLKRSK